VRKTSFGSKESWSFCKDRVKPMGRDGHPSSAGKGRGKPIVSRRRDGSILCGHFGKIKPITGRSLDAQAKQKKGRSKSTV